MRINTLTAVIALAIGTTLFSGHARAQVQLFDQVPSVDQLREVLIPESKPSASRSIVIGKMPATPKQIEPATLTSPAQSAPTQSAPAQSAPAQSAPAQSAPAQSATPAPAAQPDTTVAVKPASKPALAEKNGVATAVGFRINFGFNSADIPPDSVPYLNAIADLLRQERSLVLQVEGHTDAVGSEDYNLDLSRRRAESVTRYLMGKGVALAQLMPIGKGKLEPLVSDPYDARNRRVQFDRVAFQGNRS